MSFFESARNSVYSNGEKINIKTTKMKIEVLQQSNSRSVRFFFSSLSGIRNSDSDLRVFF